MPGVTTAIGTATPVPLKATVWVDPATLFELSVIVNVVLRAPVALGVKVTVIEQLAPIATEAPQLLVSAKSVALPPFSATLAIVKAALPELVTVIFSALLAVFRFWLPNPITVGVTTAVGTFTPVPASETACVAPVTALELSVIVRVALRAPIAPGVKVTEMLQFAPAATEVQPLARVKSVAFVPLSPTPLTVSAEVPALVTTMVCAAVAIPTF